MAKPIGYGSPPEHTRWKKGQSGNPRGREKGQLNLKTDLLAELSETIQINERGTPKRMTKQRALLKSLTARAIQGDSRAANLILIHIGRLLDLPADAGVKTPLPVEDQAALDRFLARKMRKEGA